MKRLGIVVVLGISILLGMNYVSNHFEDGKLLSSENTGPAELRVSQSMIERVDTTIYILQEYQGQGIGRRLVTPVVEQLLDKNIHTMLVLVLEENKSCLFYEALGARKMDRLDVEIGGVNLKEVVYGWEDSSSIFTTST
ncbi:N-acetyltransferase family protein [Ferdinandcohnia sp. Marseille-Q9671]